METLESSTAASSKEQHAPAWINALALLVWLVAGLVAFLPFALDTSPWDAVTLRVPGNQGNWWHALIGAPFFLAFPMIWLRLRALFSRPLSTAAERRVILGVAGLSVVGTVLVETPFLRHLAGTSAWQRFVVLGLGFGIVIASAILLFLRRSSLLPTQTCLISLGTAYLANAALCLVVYSEATGPLWSRSGWLISVIIIWPMVLEIIWLFRKTFTMRQPQNESRAA